MDFRELKIFLTLADQLHFGRTSALCSVSSSALSRTIQRMEDELGCRLFDRGNRSVVLTHEGELFQKYARQVIYGWEDFVDLLDEEQEDLRGNISIYCSVTACYTILPKFIEEFRNKYPKVHINLETGDAAASLKKLGDGQFDIVIAAMPNNLPKGMHFIEVEKTPLVLVVPQKSEINQSNWKETDWSGNPFVLQKHGVAKERLEDWWKRTNVVPEVYGEVSGNEAIISLVALGCGVGVIPRLVYDKSPMRDLVKIIDFGGNILDYEIGICVMEKKLTKGVINAFIKNIIE